MNCDSRNLTCVVEYTKTMCRIWLLQALTWTDRQTDGHASKNQTLIGCFPSDGLLRVYDEQRHQRIASIFNEANGTLVFIKRWSKAFNDPKVTRLLYTSLVRSNIEYCSCVWSPHHKLCQDQIDSVQKSDSKLLCRFNCRLFLCNLSLPAVEVIFLLILIMGDVTFRQLLERLRFNLPFRANRNFNALFLPTCTFDYALQIQICFYIVSKKSLRSRSVREATSNKYTYTARMEIRLSDQIESLTD